MWLFPEHAAKSKTGDSNELFGEQREENTLLAEVKNRL
jgi:hypothetical protein